MKKWKKLAAEMEKMLLPYKQDVERVKVLFEKIGKK